MEEVVNGGSCKWRNVRGQKLKKGLGCVCGVYVGRYTWSSNGMYLVE